MFSVGKFGVTKLNILKKCLAQMLWSRGEWECTARLWNDNFSTTTNFHWRPAHYWLRTSKEYITVTTTHSSEKKLSKNQRFLHGIRKKLMFIVWYNSRDCEIPRTFLFLLSYSAVLRLHFD